MEIETTQNKSPKSNDNNSTNNNNNKEANFFDKNNPNEFRIVGLNETASESRKNSPFNEFDDPKETDISMAPPKPPPPPRNVALGYIHALFLIFPSLAFILASIGLPWYRRQQYLNTDAGVYRSEELFYLFKSVFKANGTQIRVIYPDNYCYSIRVRTKVLEAFVISSAFMALLTLGVCVACVLKKGHRKMHRALKALSGCTLVGLSIAVAFNLSIYYWSFTDCPNEPSYRLRLYEPSVGYVLIIMAWVLIICATYITGNNITIPWDARSLRICSVFFLLFEFAAFTLSLLACFIPHWFYKNGTNARVSDVLLWYHREGNFNWNYTSHEPRSFVYVSDLGCPDLITHFRVIEGFSIASVSLNFFAFITGFLLCLRLSGTILPAAIFSYVGCITTLLQLALELKVYYTDWCNGKYVYNKHFYILSSGFEVVVCAFCFTLVASIDATILYFLDKIFFALKGPWKSAKCILLEFLN